MSDRTTERGRIRIIGFDTERGSDRSDHRIGPARNESSSRSGSAIRSVRSPRDDRLSPRESKPAARNEPPVGIDRSARTRTRRVRPSRWRQAGRRFLRDRTGVFGLVVVCSLSLLALFARPIELWGVAVQPFSIAPYSSTEILWLNHDVSSSDPPSIGHPMGIDGSGRDVFSRVLVGGRYSISIGFVVVAITSTIGLVYGAVSAYYGGRIDELLMRIVDTVLAFPGLVLALVIVAMFGGGYWQLVAAFSLFGWASYARLVRGEVLSVKENEYILAARALGARDRSIIARHVIPNTLAPVIALATLNVGTVVIGVAALGFLGLGMPPGTAEWGTMLENSRDAMIPGPDGDVHWWVTVFPGGAIFAFVLSMNVIGDAVSDALDVRGTDMGRRDR